MTLIEQIKSKNLEARKAKLAAVVGVLTPLIGEAEMVGKNANREVTDAEVVQMIKKFIKNLDETIRVLGDNDPRTLAAMGEKHTLEQFLPKQMDADHLAATVRAIVIGLKMAQAPKIDMGAVMKALKERFDGQYDGKVASAVIKAELAA